MTFGNDPPDILPGTKQKTDPKQSLTHNSSRQLRLNFRQAAVLAAVPLTATSGNTLLAVGMRQIGRIGTHNWRLLVVALINPYVLAGIIMLMGFFSFYLLALSWADLTYVIPTTSLGYILVPLISHFFLDESISAYRWIGVILICCGVIVGASGPVRTGPQITSEGNE